MSSSFRILVVCTGNICRSAQAEQIIRARIARISPGLDSIVGVESVGTGALVGSGMPAEAAALSAYYGGAPTEHSARQLTTEHVRSADLVLAMAAEHRSAVVRVLPSSSRNTFIITEFAALLENVEQNFPGPSPEFSTMDAGDKLRLAVKWAAARRGYLSFEEGTPADVLDPYRRSEETYAESTRQIVEALDRTQQAALKLAQRVGV